MISHYEKIMKDLKAGERAATESADKADIKQGIAMYKQQMMEELEAISDGKDPLDAAVEAFGNARTFAEKNRLRMRIERLMLRSDGSNGSNRYKGRTAEVEKALSYITDEEKESRDTNERYLTLASAEDIREDARIKAAKARIKSVTDEYRRLQAEGKTQEALRYQTENRKYFDAMEQLNSLSRTMAENKKLLGKGYDSSIMRLIDQNRRQMARVLERTE